MTIRTVFIPKLNEIGVIKKKIEFKWYPGLSVSQKQKSVISLHEACKKQGFFPVLEVSTKSLENIGRMLSAFNMTIFVEEMNKKITLENAFQGSKVFENGGPYVDLYEKASLDAKKDIRLKTSGNLINFNFLGQQFPNIPRTFFYDWLYITALYKHNNNIFQKILQFKGFTDIEFNDEKSINCQAYSVALCLSLYNHNLLDNALENCNNFLEILKNEYNNRATSIQGMLF